MLRVAFVAVVAAISAAVFAVAALAGTDTVRERAGYSAAAAAPKTPTGCRVSQRGKILTGPRSGRQLSLTFDETLGPETPKILRILAAHDAKATFFQTGSDIDANPRLARKIVRQGHELANHSYSHADLTKLRSKQVARELARTQRASKAATGFTPCLFRAPFGMVDETVMQQVEALGMPAIFWDLGAVEWVYSDDEIAERISEEARPGSIVLFHQVINSRMALDRILDSMDAKGLSSVPVTTLLGGRFTYR